MKKIISLLLVAMMCIFLCACGGSESTSGNNSSETKTEENGFTPNQPTEETETKEEETNISDMTVEEMQKYYDVEKFVGTPRLVACRYMFGVLNPISEEEGVTMYQIEEDSRLEDLKHYDCIICDNDTPDYPADDVVAYIFIK